MTLHLISVGRSRLNNERNVASPQATIVEGAQNLLIFMTDIEAQSCGEDASIKIGK